MLKSQQIYVGKSTPYVETLMVDLFNSLFWATNALAIFYDFQNVRI